MYRINWNFMIAVSHIRFCFIFLLVFAYFTSCVKMYAFDFDYLGSDKHLEFEKEIIFENILADREPQEEELRSEDDTMSLEELDSQYESESMEELMFEDESESMEELMFEDESDSLEELEFQDESESVEELVFPDESESVEELVFPDESESVEELVFPDESESVEELVFPDESESVEELKFQDKSESLEELKFQDKSESLEELKFQDKSESLEELKFQDESAFLEELDSQYESESLEELEFQYESESLEELKFEDKSESLEELEPQNEPDLKSSDKENVILKNVTISNLKFMIEIPQSHRRFADYFFICALQYNDDIKFAKSAILDQDGNVIVTDEITFEEINPDVLIKIELYGFTLPPLQFRDFNFCRFRQERIPLSRLKGIATLDVQNTGSIKFKFLSCDHPESYIFASIKHDTKDEPLPLPDLETQKSYMCA
ncbi:hypothetical protein ABEB36_006744 [Hypothenemus hampei]|uniref:Lipoprotein n=1 Tax=Hypothenemus hampei TaxID=57062 RepID=A0ABD1ERM0_HYPHA